MLRSMSVGQGLIVAPPDVTTLEAGTRVRVILLDPTEAADEPPVDL